MKKAFQEHDFDWFFGHRYVDLNATAIAVYKMNNFEIPLTKHRFQRYDVNLDTILRSVGLPKRPGVHQALDDAKLEAEAYHRLLTGEKWSYEFSEHPVVLESPAKAA